MLRLRFVNLFVEVSQVFGAARPLRQRLALGSSSKKWGKKLVVGPSLDTQSCIKVFGGTGFLFLGHF